jgi:H+/Cl- antiporter ClcA
MSTRRETTILYYVIAFVVIVVAFLLLGGGAWIKGLSHGSSSLRASDLHWGQILISLGLGFLLGWIVSKRRW